MSYMISMIALLRRSVVFTCTDFRTVVLFLYYPFCPPSRALRKQPRSAFRPPKAPAERTRMLYACRPVSTNACFYCVCALSACACVYAYSLSSAHRSASLPAVAHRPVPRTKKMPIFWPLSITPFPKLLRVKPSLGHPKNLETIARPVPSYNRTSKHIDLYIQTHQQIIWTRLMRMTGKYVHGNSARDSLPA